MQAIAQAIDVNPYTKRSENSIRIRWDIDRDVIRGRTFDFGQKFLPDDMSLVDRLEFLTADERKLLSRDPGPDVRQHVRSCRTRRRRQDSGIAPGALKSMTGRSRHLSDSPTKVEASGNVPPHRMAHRGRHASWLSLCAPDRRGDGIRPREIDLGSLGTDLPLRNSQAGAFRQRHRP